MLKVITKPLTKLVIQVSYIINNKLGFCFFSLSLESHLNSYLNQNVCETIVTI